ncbi:hypothetical protein Dimus_010644, partial [Dionaea muscipula]
MARSDEQPCDLCNRHHQGATCPVMNFVHEQMAQFSRRGNQKRRNSSKRPMRQDHTMSPVGNRRIGRPSFSASRSEKTPARGSERTTDRWFEDSFLDRTSIQIPDRRGNLGEQHTPTTTEGGGHGDPIPMGHMVDATIAEQDGQEDPTPM